jgi:stearoyl-CoA desaturase (delta-9 desaturase)
VNPPTSLAQPVSTTDTAPPTERLSLAGRVATFLGITVPFLAIGAGVALFWGWGFSWVHLGLLLGMYGLTAVGITVGFHRLFTHRSFEAHPAVRFVLAALGSMAVQGNLLKWVALHRKHHQHSDQPGDPHTPHHSGGGVIGLVRGAWHSHVGWAFDADPKDLPRYVKDLSRSRSLRVASALFPLWVVLGLAIPTALGGLLTWSWAGCLLGLIWGGLVRVFLVHHVTWSVNSACHLWGARPHESGDHSRNNVLFGVLALGEGWHNNHHAFPTSARHGLRWWQIDVSYWVIRALAAVGLAWDVKLEAVPAAVSGGRRGASQRARCSQTAGTK